MASEGCSFVAGMKQRQRLWTRSPCNPPNTAPSPAPLVYSPIRNIEPICNSAGYHIAQHANISLDACLRNCDAATGTLDHPISKRQSCSTAAYSFVTRDCRLLRHCDERASTRYGQCSHGWMLQGRQKLIEWVQQYNHTISTPRDPSFEWCHYTRGPTSVTSTSIRRRKRFASAWRKAEAVRSELERMHPNATICKAPLLNEEAVGRLILPTFGKVWRYYTAFACGGAARPRICLSFKKMGSAAVLGGLSSFDGLNFGNRSDLLRLPAPWQESMFTHNVALLPLGEDEYVMLGGLQGFVSNATCRGELQASGTHLPAAEQHAACLQLDRREPYFKRVEGPADQDLPPSSGIRLSRGHGLPWTSGQWTQPKIVITGDSPGKCDDRRPHFTGYPRLRACQFDGRLSLVRDSDGQFLLYARANLKFGAVSGGRFVQVTRSEQLDRGWAEWQPVHIRGTDPDAMDLYFFAVQTNPVDRSSVLALFPLTEPPFACIAFAVSIDGIHFSRPVNLRQSLLGVRPAERRSGLAESKLEWRGEDHPAAGAVRSPTDPGAILLYVHHAVKGTTVRRNATPHLRAYRLSATELLRQTRRGLRELRDGG